MTPRMLSHRCRVPAFLATLFLAGVTSRADPNVVISASADPAYTARKYANGRVLRESYVVMQGHFFPGNTVDRSIDRMPFRRICEVFAPELARREYWPAKEQKEADLLIVVHWGTTAPRASMLEMLARTSPHTDTEVISQNQQTKSEIAAANEDFAGALAASLVDEAGQMKAFETLEELTDAMDGEYARASAATLLGYDKSLRKFAASLSTTEEEYTLRMDLKQERYFVILRAYDLHDSVVGRSRRPVWTMHLNMSSAGNNFQMAVSRMSLAAIDFVGRETPTVATLRPKVREGKVEIGSLVIVGEK